MDADTALMIAALVMMFGAVSAKVLTTQLVHKAERRIASVEQDKRKALGKLRTARMQKEAAGKSRAGLEKKKAKLKKQKTRIVRELKTFQEERERRQRTSDEVRPKVARS